MTQTKLNLFSAIIPSRNFIIKIPISFYCFLIKLTKGKWIFHNMMWLRLRYLSRFIYKVIYICIWGTHTILYRIAHLMMIWNENAFIFNFKIILLYIHTQKQSPRISISLCKTVVGVAFTWALMKSDQKKKTLWWSDSWNNSKKNIYKGYCVHHKHTHIYIYMIKKFF